MRGCHVGILAPHFACIAPDCVCDIRCHGVMELQTVLCLESAYRIERVLLHADLELADLLGVLGVLLQIVLHVLAQEQIKIFNYFLMKFIDFCVFFKFFEF